MIGISNMDRFAERHYPEEQGLKQRMLAERAPHPGAERHYPEEQGLKRNNRPPVMLNST